MGITFNIMPYKVLGLIAFSGLHLYCLNGILRNQYNMNLLDLIKRQFKADKIVENKETEDRRSHPDEWIYLTIRTATDKYMFRYQRTSSDVEILSNLIRSFVENPELDFNESHGKRAMRYIMDDWDS
jgi:hypothetical protein